MCMVKEALFSGYWMYNEHLEKIWLGKIGLTCCWCLNYETMGQMVKSCFRLSKHVCKRYCPCEPSLSRQKATLCIHLIQTHAGRTTALLRRNRQAVVLCGMDNWEYKARRELVVVCLCSGAFVSCGVWGAFERILERSWWPSLCIMSDHGCVSTKKYKGEVQEAKHNILIGEHGVEQELHCSIQEMPQTMRDPLCVYGNGVGRNRKDILEAGKMLKNGWEGWCLLKWASQVGGTMNENKHWESLPNYLRWSPRVEHIHPDGKFPSVPSWQDRITTNNVQIIQQSKQMPS